MSIINNDIDYFSTLYYEKEQQFVLLNMERFKEEDIEYLYTLNKEQLMKIQDNIKNICNNIFHIDEKLIEICNNIEVNVDNQNYVKYILKLNHFLNVSLLRLMKSLQYSIQVYKFWEEKKTSANTDYYFRMNQVIDLQMSPKSPSQKAVSPPQKAVSPSQKAVSPPQKAVSPKAASPSQIPSQIPPPKASPPNASQELDKFITKNQCNIGTLLVKEKDYPFLNAIFDYGMYKKQLHIIYSKLIAYYHKIENFDNRNFNNYFNKFNKINDAIANLTIIMNKNNKDQYDNFNSNLTKNTYFYINPDNDECNYIQYTHNNKKNDFYDSNLNNFVYFMLYIQDLYIHTLGKTDFLNDIKNYLETHNEQILENAGWNANIINAIIDIMDFNKLPENNEYYNLILINYSANPNLINKKIFEKIFSEEIVNIEPFYIIYSKIEFSYEESVVKKNTAFKFFKEKLDKKYIRIMQDSNNKYFNIFSIEEGESDHFGIA